ncbi:MAG: TonB-dependent receptor [Sulfurimonas sp.]|jgi:iron complex outermembrane receptor protein
MRFLVSVLLFAVLLFSEELSLDNLLKKYESAEELYHTTKKESAGHIILFSRSDLDNMQAYTLNDVLKTLRFFTIQTRKNGMTTLVKSTESQMSGSPVKIYINSHELNSATLGNALVQYGKMGLYFIDHIEIYQAGNSVTFGNEPGTMLIRLYTKEPSRENVTSTQTSVDSLGSITLQAINTEVFDDYSYLANVDLRKNNHENYTINNSELSRDGARGQFYFKFSKNSDYDIEIGATSERYDVFSGLGMAATDGYTHTQDVYAHVTKYFENDIKAMLTASHEKFELYNQDSSGIPLPSITPPPNELRADIGTEVYSAIIEKKFINGNNELSLGTQYKHQEFKINKYETDGISVPMSWGPKDLDIFMVYAENLYNINENHLISLSAKFDHYENELSKSSTQHILRAGYVGVFNKEWKFKLFAMESYMYPTFLQTTYSPNYNINPDLASAEILTLTAEMIYNKNNTTLTLGGGNSQSDNAIVFNMTQNKYVNSSEKNSFDILYANAEYKFDIDNKIKVECFKEFREDNYSPHSGGSIQLFNTIGKFDLYNELIYRSDYTSIDGINIADGYDYSLGVIHKLNRQTELKLKAENILDKASETPINGVGISAIDRRVLLTLEYIF